jgi:hypothetical protein
MFNERLRQNNFNFGAGSSFPNLTGSQAVNDNVSTFDVAALPVTPPGMTVWPRNNTMPTIYSWYAGWQQEVPWHFTLDASYSGSHSVHLMDQRQLNALPAGYLQQNAAAYAAANNDVDVLRPYVGWGSLNAVETNSNARYNAMMLRLSRRFENNLSVNFNYTLSRAMNENDNDDSQIANPFNIRQSWGLAGYDQTHVFSTDVVYDLPSVRGALDRPALRAILNGWEVTGIFRVQSGMPFTIVSNGNLFGTDLEQQWVNVVGDPYAGQTKTQWINPAAIQRPEDGSWGNEKRNQFRLPTIPNLDASLIKNFRLSERMNLAYRFEVFNVANHPEIWAIDTTFNGDNPLSGLSTTDRTFGQPNSWRDQRTIQMALRFSF